MPRINGVTVIPRAMGHVAERLSPSIDLRPGATISKRSFVFEALRAGREHYDVVICCHVNLLPLAAILSGRLGARLVLIVYGVEVWRSPFRFARHWVGKPDGIWSISAITQKRMNFWARQPDAKYTLLPNAIHLDTYRPGPKLPALVNRYSLDGCQVIMTLGRLASAERYKGVDEVLQLMPSLLNVNPGLRYLVVGDGDDRSRLEAKARNLGLGSAVLFCGMIAEDEKQHFLRLADAFVMPGRGEGFGFVYLEALACGVPTVGSWVDGSREALRGGLLGELVDPGDAESLRQGIMRALAKPRGVPEGIEFFDWPTFKFRLSQAVSSILVRE